MDGVRPDLIDLSRVVPLEDLGARIRSARIRAGLTQAQLAGDVMSVAYVSRIETGHRRPAPDLLDVVAARLGVDAEQLLTGGASDRVVELRVALDHAQLALAGGDAGAALAGADQVVESLEELSLPSSVELVRQGRLTRALALEATGDVEGAIDALEVLVDGEQRDAAWVEAMTALSRCHRESGDLARAVEVGDRAVGHLADHGLDGLGESLALTLTVAAAHFERGDVAHAIRMCRRVLAAAESRGDSEAKAAAYWNASVMESRAGRHDVALDLASKALEVFEAGEDARNLARLRTQVGIMILRTSAPEPEAALALLHTAQRELAWTRASSTDCADNLLAQARAHFLMDDLPRTEELIDEVLAVAGGRSPLVVADALVLRGRVLAAQPPPSGEPAGAAVERTIATYREAIGVLTGLGADRGAAQLWFELGGLLEELGESGDALDAYRRAAASTGLVASALHARTSAAVR